MVPMHLRQSRLARARPLGVGEPLPPVGMGQAMLGAATASTGNAILDALLGAGVGWVVAPAEARIPYAVGGALATALFGVLGLAGTVGFRVLVSGRDPQSFTLGEGAYESRARRRRRLRP
jgi:hypothetical protein